MCCLSSGFKYWRARLAAAGRSCCVIGRGCIPHSPSASSQNFATRERLYQGFCGGGSNQMHKRLQWMSRIPFLDRSDLNCLLLLPCLSKSNLSLRPSQFKCSCQALTMTSLVTHTTSPSPDVKGFYDRHRGFQVLVRQQECAIAVTMLSSMNCT